MSITTAKTVARARAANLLPWTVPQSSLWSDVIKRMLTGQEQICQTYLALIHGTKAILYFTHGWVVHEEQWQALKALAAQVNRLVPALTAVEPLQTITYEPGSWAPLKGDVPDVQCRLIRYPDGPYVLLAANVRRSAVEAQFEVKGLADRQARDLFAGPVAAVSGGVFAETLPARGVRAYAFDRISTNGPVCIAVRIKPLGKEGPIEDGYRHEGRKGLKNIQANPSFEEATLAGFPDYYWPFDYHGLQGGWRHRIGTPDAVIGLTDQKPFHGERCLFMRWREPQGSVGIIFRCAPQHPTEQAYVLSFYARAETSEPVEARFKVYGRSAGRLTIEGTDWKRYSQRLTIPPKADSHSILFMFVGGPMCIDAMQLEQGQVPTEFQP